MGDDVDERQILAIVEECYDPGQSAAKLGSRCQRMLGKWKAEDPELQKLERILAQL